MKYIAAGRHDEAVASYEHALRLSPGLAVANYNLAISLLALGRTPEARAHFERARQLDPGLPAVQF